MKIECPKCSYKNLLGSEYCQECGTNLSKLEKRKESKPESDNKKPIHKEIEEISDVIFKPKKKRSLASWFVIIVFIGLGLFALFLVLASFSEDISSPDTSTTIEESADFPISYLNITDYDVIFDDYGESYFVGTLKNAYSRAARNVKIRLDFYYDEALKRHFDTRNAIIKNGAEAKGAFSFEVPLNFYPQDQFWWIWEIESADYGL